MTRSNYWVTPAAWESFTRIYDACRIRKAGRCEMDVSQKLHSNESLASLFSNLSRRGRSAAENRRIPWKSVQIFLGASRFLLLLACRHASLAQRVMFSRLDPHSPLPISFIIARETPKTKSSPKVFLAHRNVCAHLNVCRGSCAGARKRKNKFSFFGGQ